MTTDPPRVRVQRDGGLATIELCGPRGNALDGAMLDALITAIDDANNDDDVRGVLLTATGRIFCPGLDLRALPRLRREPLRAVMSRFADALYALYALPKPLVVAMAGHALAGGCVIALSGDWRIIGADARIGMSAMRLGVPLPYGVVQLLRDALAPAVVGPLVLEGNMFDAAGACAAGLAHEMRAGDDVRVRAEERLATLASANSRAYALTKAALRDDVLGRLRAEAGRSLDDFLDQWFSPDTQARLRDVAARLESK